MVLFFLEAFLGSAARLRGSCGHSKQGVSLLLLLQTRALARLLGNTYAVEAGSTDTADDGGRDLLHVLVDQLAACAGGAVPSLAFSWRPGALRAPCGLLKSPINAS
jgi:hypothetical protein